MNAAWRVCEGLIATPPPPVIYDAALRFALIAYARAYARSDGTHRAGRHAYCRPAPSHLSPEQLELHYRILELRHQELAHCDLTVRDAIVSVGRFAGIPHATIAQNSSTLVPDPQSVLA